MPLHADRLAVNPLVRNNPGIASRSRLRIILEVVHHHRRQHSVEFSSGVRQLLGVAAFEANPGQTSSLSLRPPQCQRVGIRSDDFGFGMRRWLSIIG
jgi:hypothetical protein